MDCQDMKREIIRLKKIETEILFTFRWDETPQGEDYWFNVHDNLENLIKKREKELNKKKAVK